MTGPLAPLATAARLQAEGRLDEAVATIDGALAAARATPFEVPFQARVQLGLALADLYLTAAAPERARALLPPSWVKW